MNHHIGSKLGSAKQGVGALIDAKVFCNTESRFLVRIFPALFEFNQRNEVWRVPVYLVRGHVDEWRVRTVEPGRLKKMEGSIGIRLKIVEGNTGRKIV